jgi:alpha-N-arabinofuranosidase
MTENGGKAWAQTIFYPYMFASRFGRGTTLKPIIKSDTYETSYNCTVPYVEASVIQNSEKRELIVFAVNRSLDEDMELNLVLEGFDTASLFEHVELFNEDLKAVNTAENSDTITPTKRETDSTPSANQTIKLKKHSWNMLRFNY